MLKIFGEARLTKDVTVKTVMGDKMVANATIANNRGTGDNQQTDFIDIVGWENVAKGMQEMNKGQLVNISGTFQMRSWTDKEGKTRTTPEIVLDSISLANYRKKADGTAAPAAPATTAKKETKKAAPAPVPDDDFSDIEDDGDLPF